MTRRAVTGKSIARILLENELAWRSETDVRAGLLHIWGLMQECVSNGIATEGTLLGGLRVRRRAPELARRLAVEEASIDPLRRMDWITLYALAVNDVPPDKPSGRTRGRRPEGPDFLSPSGPSRLVLCWQRPWS